MKNYIIYTSLLAILFIFSASVFTVHQNQYAIVFQFGEAVRSIQEPGLNFKVPGIQSVEYFDKRILNVTVEAKELTGSDNKRIIVDAFAKFYIQDPVKFYTSVYNFQSARIRLNKILEASMREVIGKRTIMDLLSEQRNDVMNDILALVNKRAQGFGIDIKDVRLLRTDLPQENSSAIYRRMQTAREQEAKQIRAEGQEEAARIKSDADKQSKITLAEAYMKAQILKGEAERKAATIYNSAYSKDPEFYKFYKTLMVYKNSIGDGKTEFVLSPDSEFLKILNVK